MEASGATLCDFVHLHLKQRANKNMNPEHLLLLIFPQKYKDLQQSACCSLITRNNQKCFSHLSILYIKPIIIKPKTFLG